MKQLIVILQQTKSFYFVVKYGQIFKKKFYSTRTSGCSLSKYFYSMPTYIL